MSDTIIKDVLYAKEYENKVGEVKTEWLKIGTSFQKDKDGSQWIHIKAIPIDVLSKGEMTIQIFPNQDSK